MSGKVVVVVYRQGLSKIFRAAIYRAHRAVVFAIAQLSCLQLEYLPKIFNVNKCIYENVNKNLFQLFKPLTV